MVPQRTGPPTLRQASASRATADHCEGLAAADHGAASTRRPIRAGGVRTAGDGVAAREHACAHGLRYGGPPLRPAQGCVLQLSVLAYLNGRCSYVLDVQM